MQPIPERKAATQFGSETVSGAAQAIVTIDETGRIVEWNDAAEFLFGWSRKAAVGKLLTETIVPDFFREAHSRGLEAFIATHRPHILDRLVEVTALRRDGIEVPIELLVTRSTTDDGGHTFTAVLRDISGRQRSERLRSMQLAVSRSLIERENPAAALRLVLEAVAETLGCALATLWVFDGESESLRLRDASVPASQRVAGVVERLRSESLPQADIIGRVWRSGLPFVLSTGMPHPSPLMTLMESAGLQWMAAFPLAHAQTVAGALVLFATDVLAVDEDLLAAMGSIGSQVSQTLARSHAEAALRESEQQYRSLFESTPNPILVYETATGRILAVNDAAVSVYGYSVDEFLGMAVEDIHISETAKRARVPTGVPVKSLTEWPGAPHTSERHRLRDGRIIDVEITARMDMFRGRPATLALIHDVTDRLALQRDLWNQAFHDSLTGLGNRALFTDRLEHALARLTRGDEACAVLLLDLDDFKSMNDSRGHRAGDQLLCSVAERLAKSVRPGDTVARLGGDEFAVLLEGLALIAEAEAAASRILAALEEPFLIEGQDVRAHASIGIAVTDEVTVRADEIMRNADIAMYHAKAGGKSRYQTFVKTMHTALLERMAFEQEMRAALERDELRVLYQPQVDVSTGRIVAVEALVRWEHPRRGLLSADAFITMAESTGLIHGIGLWVLTKACHQAQEWTTRGVSPVQMSVNLSAHEIGDVNLVSRIAGVLLETGLPPSQLELEITETGGVEQPTEALTRLAELRRLGVRVAIDDFGTGYSMLGRLQTFPVDKLKIDKSFVDGITLAIDSAPLVAAMVVMGHGLGLHVVAEGVETPEQLAFLRRHHCDGVQGYLFSRALTAADFEELMLRTPGELAPALPDEQLDPLALLSQVVHAAPTSDEVIQALLGELERISGIDTIYITESRSDGGGERVRYGRRGGRPDPRLGRLWSAREALLGSYASVPIVFAGGKVFGSLWGGGRSRPARNGGGPDVMQLFSRVIATQLDPACGPRR